MTTIKGTNSSMALWVRPAKGLIDLTSPAKLWSILTELIIVTFKRPDRPNKPGKANGYSSKVSKHLDRIKKPSEADIHVDKLQSKSTVDVRVNSECNSTLRIRLTEPS